MRFRVGAWDDTSICVSPEMIKLAKRIKSFVTNRLTPDPRLQLLDRMPQRGRCAEVGVWKGEFSEMILKHTQPRTLFLVDPWTFQPEFAERMYGGSVAGDQESMDAIYEQVRQTLGQRAAVEIVRDYSDAAADAIEDETLDFVYIDGNHFYEYVKQDLENYCAKVKPGGYLTGDDYQWGEEHGYPVRKAVTEFAETGPVEWVDRMEGQYILRKT